MSSNPETFVEHMWPWIAHTLTGHVLAMAREGLIDQDMGETLAAAIDRVREQPAADEDLVSLVRSFEQLLAAQLTPEVEAASRVGRSNVDVSATVARLATLERLNALDQEARRCEAATLALAERNFVTLMPVTMDGFVSQPTSVAHWLGSLIEQLGRARDRILAALETVDASPMGANALASSGFAVDRAAIAVDLGFNRVIENTFDAVSSLDWISVAAEAMDAVMNPLKRFCDEVFTWCRIEPTSFKIGDWLIDSVSGIPQWSGPFGLVRLTQDLEHVAFQAHVLAHEASSVGYGPQLASLGRLAYGLDAIGTESAGLISEVAHFLEDGLLVNAAYFSNRAGRSFSTSSDLADFLIIEERLTPSEAEQIAALTISRARDQGLEAAGITADLIDGAAMMVIGRELKVEFEAISRYLAPRRFIERRTALGAPSPDAVRTFVAHRRQDHNERNERMDSRWSHLESAALTLRSAAHEASPS
ncbi:MAG TPA: lyase family protein [Thermomicrobiales bacterium]|nr:lyase family protein [Thermomicrobiales bacterium]